MSFSNPLYMDYKSIISSNQEKMKNLRQKLSTYSDQIESGSNTILIENEIEKDISSLKDSLNELESAYNYKNAPSQMSSNEIDRRQKEIKKLQIDLQELEKDYRKANDKKYEYKGPSMDNYQPTDEMKTMSNSELNQGLQLKIKKQDQEIDDIILDVKKGKVLAKEAVKIMDDQNKQLDELQEDIDRLDSRLKRGAKRFENYVAKKSGCCIVVILVLEFIAGILIYTLI